MTLSLRARQTAETRKELIKAGTELFGEKGFAAVSTTEIVDKAGVTRGALYHHFKDGKPDLFYAVAEQMQIDLVAKMEAVYNPALATKTILGRVIEVYFAASQDKHFNRVVMQDGASALGYMRWRALEHQYSLKFMRDRLLEMQQKKAIINLPVDMLASALFGAACEVSLAMGAVKDKKKAKADAVKVISALCASLIPNP